MMIDIRSLPGVPSDILMGLGLLGLKTVEGFLSLMQIHESREAFKKMVGLSESALGRSIQQLREHLPKSCGAMHPSPVMPVQLGLSWGHVEASYPANYFGSMAHDLPRKKSISFLSCHLFVIRGGAELVSLLPLRPPSNMKCAGMACSE